MEANPIMETTPTIETMTEETSPIQMKFPTKEITINKPTPFTGDWTKVWGFVQECLGYLQLNKHVYTADEAKVAFILSFLTDKEALKWKETYLATIWDDDEGFKYPTFKEFLELFTLYFKPINQTQTANNQLISLKQGKRTVEEYLAEFRLLTSLAGMTSDTPSDNIHLINYFQRGLNPAIAKKIALSDSVPTTITEWSDRAVQYDTNYRLTMAMLGKTVYGKPDNDNWRAGSSYRRDPNAMDIDVMTTDKRTSLMKQGLCFRCEEKGHLARDCKKAKKNAPPQKRNIQDIHAVLATLNKEEKKELLSLQEASSEDFWNGEPYRRRCLL